MPKKELLIDKEDSDKERTARFYDVVWKEYIPEFTASEKHWEVFYTTQEVKNTCVLDAGCGTGVFSLIFTDKGAANVVGVDISEQSLETAWRLKAKHALPNLTFLRDDMLRLPFQDASFDIVWAWGTVHHTIDPFQALSELTRVLKPRGSLLLTSYRKTKLTFFHEILRKTLLRTPRKSWKPLSKILSFFLSPVVSFFKRREKSRQGEKLEALILDWYFVPIKHFFHPEEIKSYLEAKGFRIEKFLPYSGRFNSTSNFIFKARKQTG